MSLQFGLLILFNVGYLCAFFKNNGRFTTIVPYFNPVYVNEPHCVGAVGYYNIILNRYIIHRIIGVLMDGDGGKDCGHSTSYPAAILKAASAYYNVGGGRSLSPEGLRIGCNCSFANVSEIAVFYKGSSGLKHYSSCAALASYSAALTQGTTEDKITTERSTDINFTIFFIITIPR